MKMENNLKITEVVINSANELFVILGDNKVIYICGEIQGGSLGEGDVVRVRVKNRGELYHELRYNNGEFIELVRKNDGSDTIVNRAVYPLEKLEKRMDELMREDKLFAGRLHAIIMRGYSYVLIPEIHYRSGE